MESVVAVPAAMKRRLKRDLLSKHALDLLTHVRVAVLALLAQDVPIIDERLAVSAPERVLILQVTHSSTSRTVALPSISAMISMQSANASALPFIERLYDLPVIGVITFLIAS